MNVYYIENEDTGEYYGDGQWQEEPELFDTVREALAASAALCRVTPSPTVLRSRAVESGELE